MPESSDIEVARDQRGTALVLAPQGDIDLSRAPSLRSQLVAAIEERPGRVVVDMDQVGYMDSSGVATLIEALTTAQGRAVDFHLANLNEPVLATLQITRLDTVFDIVDDVDTFLAT